ncbi:MAG: type II secretion system protein GspK, partial [Armatimonadota bacterium]
LLRAVAAVETADTNRLSLEDEWATLGSSGDEEFELDGATYRLQIVDAGSLIDINSVTADQLALLPIESEQSDSLLDWREGGTVPRSSGAKDEYYTSLETDYQAARAPFRTVSELLLVKGWTPRNLYGLVDEVQTTASVPTDADGNPLPIAALLTVGSGAPNTTAQGTNRVNINVANLSANVLVQFGLNLQTAIRVAQGGPYNNLRELLLAPGVTPDVQQRILDGATAVATQRVEGLVNVNTASQTVLETLGLTSDIASAVVSRQSPGFATLGELGTVPGLDGPELARIADRVTLGGDTWLVRAQGRSGAVTLSAEAIVGVRDGRTRVLGWAPTPDLGTPAWWGWSGTNGIGGNP